MYCSTINKKKKHFISVFSVFDGIRWWWACSWLIFSLKWCLQSPFLLLHSAAIDLQEVKDSIDEEDQGLQALHGAPLLGSVQDAFVCKEVKALLGRKVSSGRKTLKDFQDLEERVKSLKALKEHPISKEVVSLIVTTSQHMSYRPTSI